MRYRLAVVFSVFLFAASQTQAQQNKGVHSGCKAQVARIVQGLPPFDEVKMALERGIFGDGVRQGWMDKMQRDNVRRADFEIDFSVGRAPETLKVTKTRIYSDYSATRSIELQDPGFAEKIAADGLEQDLQEAAIEGIRAVLKVVIPREGLTRASGHIFYSLFDNECIAPPWGALELRDPDETPLMSAAVNNDLEAVKRLLAAGADVNAKNQQGDTALLLASRPDGHSQVVALLLNSGADANARNDDGDTALMWAAFADDLEMVNVLLNSGADLTLRDRRGATALQWAFSKGDLTRYAVSGGRSNIQNVIAITRDLISAGADVNSKDNRGVTPLIQAARSGLVSVVKELIAQGVDTSARDKSGMSALDYATEDRLPDNKEAYAEIAEILRAVRK